MIRWIGCVSMMIAFCFDLAADEESFDLDGPRLLHVTTIRRDGQHSEDVSPPALVAAIKKSPEEYRDLAIYDRTALCQLDGQRAWFAITTSREGKDVIVLDYTDNGGQKWRQTVAAIMADSVKISSLDNQHGFFLRSAPRPPV